MEKLYTPKEAAKYLRITPVKLYRMLNNGEIRGSKFARQWRISEKDLKDFENKYPDVDITKLDEDQRFLKFAKGKIGVYPLAEIYTDFVELFGELESTVKTELKNKLQRQQAYSQASVKINSASSEPTYYSMDQLRKMSKEEIRKNYEKVMKSYEYHTTKK